MGKNPEIIYLNESLLDDVEVDEVNDEQEYVEGICYEFLFNFNADDMSESAIAEIFYGSVMEPALARLKNLGYVCGWVIDRKFRDIGCSAIIDVYSQRRFLVNGSLMLKKSKTLGFVLCLENDHGGTASLASVSAILINAFDTSNICTENRGIRMVASRVESRENPVHIGYSICIARSKNIWSFYAGNDDGNPVMDDIKVIQGNFVRIASRIGLMEAVDKAGDRYVATSFGITPVISKEYMMLIDSSGNILFDIDITLSAFDYGPKFLDNGLMRVKFAKECYNYINLDGEIICDEDFSSCSPAFSEGYARIKYGFENKYNMLAEDGTFLCDDKYDSMYEFVDGLAVVMKGNSYNFIDKTGKPVCNEWYADLEFENGSKHNVAVVRKYCDDKIRDIEGNLVRKTSNYVDRNGNLLLDDWIPGRSLPMNNGFAKVHNGKDCKYRYIREDGTPVSGEWFDDVCGWPECGMYAFKKNGYWQFMDMESGKPMFDGECFEYVKTYFGADNLYEVSKYFKKDNIKKDLKKTLISDRGMKCSDEWFYSVTIIGYLVVAVREIGSPTIIIDWNTGKVVLDNLKYVDDCIDGIMKVAKPSDSLLKYSKSMFNFIDETTTSLVSDEWFVYTGKPENGFMIVKRFDKSGNEFFDVLAYRSGTFMSPKLAEGEYVRNVYAVEPDKLVIVEKAGNYDYFLYNIFDASGKQILGEWTRFCIRPVSEGVLMVGPSAYVDYSGKPVSFI